MYGGIDTAATMKSNDALDNTGPEDRTIGRAMSNQTDPDPTIKGTSVVPAYKPVPKLRPIDHRRLQVLFETVSPVKVQPPNRPTEEIHDQSSAATPANSRYPIYENAWVFPRDWTEPRRSINITVSLPAGENATHPVLPAKTKRRTE